MMGIRSRSQINHIGKKWREQSRNKWKRKGVLLEKEASDKGLMSSQ